MWSKELVDRFVDLKITDTARAADIKARARKVADEAGLNGHFPAVGLKAVILDESTRTEFEQAWEKGLLHA